MFPYMKLVAMLSIIMANGALYPLYVAKLLRALVEVEKP